MFTIGSAITSLDSSFVADVHLPLLGGAATAAIAANAFLSTRMANEVSLTSTAMPCGWADVARSSPRSSGENMASDAHLRHLTFAHIAIVAAH